jgi:hypothetical protein
MLAFFSKVDGLSVLGHPVVTTQVVKDAFNIRRLIAQQRHNVQRLKGLCQERLAQTRAHMEFLRGADISKLDLEALGEQATSLRSNPALLEIVRGLATSAIPQLSVEAQIIRYEAYLQYVDRLEHTYAKELKVVDISTFRRRVAGAGA